ncbi:MAG: helix-turn-helix domain-containing protein [Actinomycetota bacterium]|jgi:excisionase family DNA binding protein|nr:helix-turn-helix domain-containing protein [Actinomycetota bacterium]
MEAEEKSWLTVKQAARELDVPLSRAYELIHSGHLPAVRLGERTLRVFRPELERFLTEERRVVAS